MLSSKPVQELSLAQFESEDAWFFESDQYWPVSSLEGLPSESGVPRGNFVIKEVFRFWCRAVLELADGERIVSKASFCNGYIRLVALDDPDVTGVLAFAEGNREPVLLEAFLRAVNKSEGGVFPMTVKAKAPSLGFAIEQVEPFPYLTSKSVCLSCTLMG